MEQISGAVPLPGHHAQHAGGHAVRNGCEHCEVAGQREGRRALWSKTADRVFELAAVGMFGGACLGSLVGSTWSVVGAIVGGVYCVWSEGVAGFGRQH